MKTTTHENRAIIWGGGIDFERKKRNKEHQQYRGNKNMKNGRDAREIAFSTHTHTQFNGMNGGEGEICCQI